MGSDPTLNLTHNLEIYSKGDMESLHQEKMKRNKVHSGHSEICCRKVIYFKV